MKNTIAFDKLDDMNRESTLSYLRLLYKDVIAFNNGEYLVCDNRNFSELGDPCRYDSDKTTVKLLDKDLNAVVDTSGFTGDNKTKLFDIMDYSTGARAFMTYERTNGVSIIKKVMFQDGRVIDISGTVLGNIAYGLRNILDNQSNSKNTGLYQIDSYIRDAVKMNEYDISVIVHISSELNPDGTSKATVCDSNVQDYYKFMTIDNNKDKHLLLLTIPGCKVIDYNIDKDTIESVEYTGYNKDNTEIDKEDILQAFLKDHKNIVRHTNDMVGQLDDTYIGSSDKIVGHNNKERKLLVDETSRSFEMLDINNRVCMTDNKNIVTCDDSLLMPFNHYIMSIGNDNARNMDRYMPLNKNGDPAISSKETNDDIVETDISWLSLAGTDYYIKKSQSMYSYGGGGYSVSRWIQIYKDIDNKLVNLYETGKNYRNLYKISKESSFTLVNGNVAFVMHMSDVEIRDVVRYIQIFYPELSLVVEYKTIEDNITDIAMSNLSLDESVNGSRSVRYAAYEAYKLNGLTEHGDPDIENYDICGLAGYKLKYFNTAETMLSTDRIGIKAYNTSTMKVVADFGNLENEIMNNIDKA